MTLWIAPQMTLTHRSVHQGSANATLSESGTGMAMAPTGGVPPVTIAVSMEVQTKEDAHEAPTGEVA
jgi:hypothetical protein